MLIESIAIGLIVGFVFYEYVGFSPGGLIVPGYIALRLDQPLMVISTLIIALFVYGLVVALSQIAVIYSRRRFLLMVITGFACQWLLQGSVIPLWFDHSENEAIGYIIPGLLANDIDRQRGIPTISSLIIVSAIVKLILITLGFFR